MNPLWRVDYHSSDGWNVVGWWTTQSGAEEHIRTTPTPCRFSWDEHPERSPEWPEVVIAKEN